MNLVKNQHYIPKSYLRGFSHKKKPNSKTDYIFSRRNQGDIFEPNIENVCAERYFYDIPELKEVMGQFTELSLAKYPDDWYREVKSFVMNEKEISLTKDMRGKIIGCCVSLIFRSPAFIKAKHDILQMNNSINGIELTEESKLQITAIHNFYQNTLALVKARYNDGVCISKAKPGNQFITSDNPVLLSNEKSDGTNYFDPLNLIRIPITSSHCIIITPSTETELHHTFYRSTAYADEVYDMNAKVKNQSIQFLLGAKNGLEMFHEQEIEFEAHRIKRKIKTYQYNDIAKKFGLVYNLIEREGINSINAKLLAAHYYNQFEYIRNDDRFKQLCKDLGVEM